jgi:hypothetical protein
MLIATAVISLTGMVFMVLGWTERSGAFEQADFQKERLDKAIKSWEAAQGTPEETQRKERVEELNGYLQSDLNSGAKRQSRGNMYLIIGVLLLFCDAIPFLLARKMARTPTE